ncbi:MAG: ribonuclease R [Bdellovibrionales bacterium]
MPTKQKKFSRRIEHKPRDKKQEKPSSVLPASQTVIGVVRKTRFGWSLVVADRKDKNKYIIRNKKRALELEDQLIAAKLLQSSKQGLQEIEITDHLGDPDDPCLVSLIAILSNEIPYQFPETVIKEAGKACPAPLDKRTDLQNIPLVTIDGKDSRDFDDAVWAEETSTGFHILVAIADVAHYVKAGSPLDQEAYKRGNSTYFPDRVVPMLPEALSNDLCSLIPHKPRACLAAHIWITKTGKIKRYQFVRGLMRSQARLTYEQVQAAYDGKANATTKPLMETVIKPLYAAYECLLKARETRGTLELDLPERAVTLDKEGHVTAIKTRQRLDSHKLIEEFMILANVAAASALSEKLNLCVYRVHDKPSDEKYDALRDFLKTLDISLPAGKELHPRNLTSILNKVSGTETAPIVSEVILRSQSQAIYSPQNIGHFGLALGQYAHFTSPIRRYADLIVHRALIRAYKLGDDGLGDKDIKQMETISEHISATERRSVNAEREAIDRYVSLFMENKLGTQFKSHISGVTRFGIFVRLDDTGAEGIIPFRSLPRDYYELDETNMSLRGQRRKKSFKLGDPLTVRLEEADRLTGSMRFGV